MTTFTTIPNSSLEPGKPIRSIDGLALRDNPLAMFEGDASAPRLVGKAVKRLQEMPVLTVSAADTYGVEVGSGPETLTLTTQSTSNVVAFRYTITNYTGSLRFRASHQGGEYVFFETGTFQTTSTLGIYKNNTLIQSYAKLGLGFVARTNDVSVAPGDVIEWRHRTNDASGSSTVSSIGAFGSNAYTSRPAYISQLDNLNP
jgi:hypothetical protein